MNEQKSVFERVNESLTESITLKLLIITVLTLLLLIPTSMIRSIINERIILRDSAIEEVSSKWANAQLLNGPVITIPMVYEKIVEKEKKVETKNLHILPNELIIDGHVTPQKLKRGIYEIVVYRSVLQLSGSFTFGKIPTEEFLKEILWDQAFVTVGISDLRGIQKQIDFKWNDQSFEVEPGSRISQEIISGITIPLPELQAGMKKEHTFSFELDLQGSKNLSFIPTGKTTKVQLNSPWTSPSFNGNFLPDHREIDEEGFTAEWTVLQLNRNFPQQWTGKHMFRQLDSSSFGVDLLLPMDDYQKSTRTVKYGIMTIALIFLIYFLVEIRNKRKIHPIQYTFVGLALSLFYVLLVAISEHLGFNLAYIISALSISALVFLYSMTIFRNRQLSMILLTALFAIFGFLFVNLQLADYALLLGSLGLTIILAITMYLTRNIKWYRE